MGAAAKNPGALRPLLHRWILERLPSIVRLCRVRMLPLNGQARGKSKAYFQGAKPRVVAPRFAGSYPD
jgi:hypothetical protein